MKRTTYKMVRDPRAGRNSHNGNIVIVRKTGRNEACPCGKKNDEGGAMKFKHCCLDK